MMARAQSITIRGTSNAAQVYTLKLDVDGKAQLLDARGASVWESDNEDDAEFHEKFGDFMEETQAEDLVDWLFDNMDLPQGAEIEVDVEYDDGPGDEDEDDEEEDDDPDTEPLDEDDEDEDEHGDY